MTFDATEVGQHARRLREFSAFDNFSDADLERLVQASHHVSRAVPWPLIREQTPSDACFILLGLVLSIWEWMKGCMKAGADIDDTPRPPKPPRKKFKPAALPNNVIRFPGKRQIRQD